MDCPVYLQKLLKNEKRKRKLTFKKENLATRVEDEVDSDGEEQKDKEALLCLVALDDDIIEVFNSNLSYFSDDDDDDDDDEINDLYHELYDSLVRVKKNLRLKIAKSLIKKIKSLEKENYDLNLLIEQPLSQSKSCVERKILKDKNLQLTKSFQNFINNKNKLELMVENQ